MDEDTVIEKNIREFVFSKTNEDVYLDVSKKNLMTIKRRSKAGSVALAMFWLRVFRHQNNYPMPKYPYKDMYDKQGNNKVILKVDTVTLTVFMSTGTLMIQGNLVLDWFLRHFQCIMDHYDAPVAEPKPDTSVFRQYTENWKKLEDHYSIKKGQEDIERRSREDRALELVQERGQLISHLTARGDNLGLKKGENLVLEDDIEKRYVDMDEKLRGYDDGMLQDLKENGSEMKEVKLEYIDDSGQLLTQKEAYRQVSHCFHGKDSVRKIEETSGKRHEENKSGGENDGEKKDIEERSTEQNSTKNLRIREDTAKYLKNLDPESAFYDPKTRSMRETAGKIISAEEQEQSQGRDCNSAGLEGTDDTFDELAEEMELMTIDKWPAESVEEQLNKLRTGCVRDGSTYIYRLWQSLLHYWFSDPDCKVYLVTPFLDATRLADICHIILQHKLEANLDAFYVRQQCDRERKIHEVKQDTLKQFKDAKDKMFIEYKIFSNIIYPMKRFHAKFMACVKAGEAQVLVTSANFHGDHFECSNMETVQFQTMSEARFIKHFLGPINASVTIHK